MPGVGKALDAASRRGEFAKEQRWENVGQGYRSSSWGKAWAMLTACAISPVARSLF